MIITLWIVNILALVATVRVQKVVMLKICAQKMFETKPIFKHYFARTMLNYISMNTVKQMPTHFYFLFH